MTLAPNLETRTQTSEAVSFPPGNLWSDEPPLESDLHLRQIMLLIECLEDWWRDRQDFYLAGNLTIYYSPRQLKSELFRGPDFFVVLGTDRKPRRSWAVWEEDGKYPNVIVELLSDSTAATDRGLKKEIYQDTFRTPEYFWFDPANPSEFEGFALIQGRYEPIKANPQGWRWSQQLQLFLGVEQSQLRFFTAQGQLVPTPQELARTEQQRADAAQQRANAEQQRADSAQQRADQTVAQLQQVIAHLLQSGRSPQEVAAMTGLPEVQVQSFANE